MFNGLSLKQIDQIFLEGESPTLTYSLTEVSCCKELVFIYCLTSGHILFIS